MKISKFIEWEELERLILLILKKVDVVYMTVGVYFCAEYEFI